jgi:hypothetical protein
MTHRPPVSFLGKQPLVQQYVSPEHSLLVLQVPSNGRQWPAAQTIVLPQLALSVQLCPRDADGLPASVATVDDPVVSPPEALAPPACSPPCSRNHRSWLELQPPAPKKLTMASRDEKVIADRQLLRIGVNVCRIWTTRARETTAWWSESRWIPQIQNT